MQNFEEKMDLPDINSEEFLKIAERRLKMMEEDYKRTLEAEKSENFVLKGKFEQENFNNVNFVNPPEPSVEKNQNENQIKNEEIENEANTDEKIENLDNETNENHENYQMICDEDSENEKEEDEEWGELQSATKEEEHEKKEKDFKIDVDKIKSIMDKIQLKEPTWATSSDVWKTKLKEMCRDLTN